MALSAKSEALKHVPWFSLAEWHQVYKQIYSNDVAEQTKAYETLLVWKARIPKLPVGVECTLSVLQVCLRDREWTPRIDEAELPLYYENDLCLMYSTTIMRFLNHISNIGHTKQSSLFQIAKQLKIPEWIVNLRHDAAHGHELPSIGALRMAANMLLTWLHEEYWAAEAKSMNDRFDKSTDNMSSGESCETQAFEVFIELWIAVGLYIKANYKSVCDLPDTQLRNMLLNLCTVLPDSPIQTELPTRGSGSVRYGTNYLLIDARAILFNEISTLISKNKFTQNIEDIVVKILFDSEAFLPSPDIVGIFMPTDESSASLSHKNLPKGMTEFWQSFISLLNDKKLLDELVWRLIELVVTPGEEANRRLIASLWIKAIGQAMVKLRITQSVTQAMEHSLDDDQKRLASKQLVQRVRDEVNKRHPELSRAMWLNTASDVPEFLKDIDFATDLLTNANSLTSNFIQPILDLVTPAISPKRKDHLSKLLCIQTSCENSKARDTTIGDDCTYGVEDLMKFCDHRVSEQSEDTEKEFSQRSYVPEVADRTKRNSKWEIASSDFDWASCAFGVLPWQIESLDMLESSVIVQPKPNPVSDGSTIVPGFLDGKDLTTESHINWDNVLRKKKRLKRKRQPGESDVIVDRAIEMVRKRQK